MPAKIAGCTVLFLVAMLVAVASKSGDEGDVRPGSDSFPAGTRFEA
jgi:hypothetical protein